ncbi:MAG TPA: lanthionine synthetase LanC family protein, partial [Acidobacteriota bacterium]|nr:lanthionine synthetase LanC family protein [Acidobacteriota bacterium]
MRKALIFASAWLFLGLTCAAQESPYLRTALQAGDWLKSQRIASEHGSLWVIDPADPKRSATNLYSGSAGIVLYFLERYQLTGEEDSLKIALSGADYLMATLPSRPEGVQAGLYTGISGVGFVLLETHRVSGRDKYLEGARIVLHLLEESAQEVGRGENKGVQWNSVTDIIGGSAGTGLFLLYAARSLESPSARRLAERAGQRLLESGRPAQGGLKWPMSEDYPRLMPNFSHGTAGIAYFLASLYKDTGRQEFLDAARRGARYLQAIATKFGDGEACLIFHHEPEGEELFYLSWCHGPAGTARLFYLLYQITGEQEWMDWVDRLARGIRQSGIPEQETPGYWNNVSVCCGAAGVAEFFLNLHQATGRAQDLSFALRMTDALLGKATIEEGQARWVQAEHRVRPELLQAQTGY